MAALDAEIRAATDGRVTFQDVLVRLEEYETPITHADLAEAVAAVTGQRFDDWLDWYIRADGQPTLPEESTAFGRPDEQPVLDAARLEFQVRGTWTADPGVVPAGVPVEVRYRGDERVELVAGANTTRVDDDTIRLSGNLAEVVVRSTVDPTVSVTVPVHASDDVDGDGLSNVAELDQGTGRWEPDTDGDGLGDGSEVHVHRTDPLVADTDGDGLNDGAEVHEYGSDPTETDIDSDGLLDGDEVRDFGTNPMTADTDDDGYADDLELRTGTDPTTPTPWWQFLLADLANRLSAWLG